MDALLYRDRNYGALALIRESGGLAMIDHQFDEQDFEPVLAVLEDLAKPIQREDGSTLWRPNGHLAVLQHNVEAALTQLGYERDPLAERSVRRLSREEAIKPDLPKITRRQVTVSEAVERSLRTHINAGLAALKRAGSPMSETVEFFGRNVTDGMRPLPFVRVRALLTRPIERAADVCARLREAIAPAKGMLTRLSAREVEGQNAYVVEFALSPDRAAVDAALGEAAPKFDMSMKLRGMRGAFIKLGGAVTLAEIAPIAERAKQCGAVLSMELKTPRRVEVVVPGTISEGAVADFAFSERLAWLHEQLAPWGPSVEEVSESQPLAEADINIRDLERKAEMGDAAAAAALQRAKERTLDTPWDSLGVTKPEALALVAISHWKPSYGGDPHLRLTQIRRAGFPMTPGQYAAVRDSLAAKGVLNKAGASTPKARAVTQQLYGVLGFQGYASGDVVLKKIAQQWGTHIDMGDIPDPVKPSTIIPSLARDATIAGRPMSDLAAVGDAVQVYHYKPGWSDVKDIYMVPTARLKNGGYKVVTVTKELGRRVANRAKQDTADHQWASHFKSVATAAVPPEVMSRFKEWGLKLSESAEGEPRQVLTEDRIDSGLRQRINSRLVERGLDGNTAFESMSAALGKISDVLMAENLEITGAVSLYGNEGRRTFDLNKINDADPFTPGPAIDNSVLVLTWHRFPSKRFEVVAHLS
jgi:hypothetical protein